MIDGLLTEKARSLAQQPSSSGKSTPAMNNKRKTQSFSRTLVHTKETSGRFPAELSYQDYKIRSCKETWERAKKLYTFIDGRDCLARTRNLEACRTRTFFAINSETKTVKVLSNACKLRWCPICQRATKANIAWQTENYIEHVKRPKFLTLTLKHSEEDLRYQIDTLYDFFKKYRKAKLLKKNVRGGIWFFQVKKNKTTGLYHPHIHILLDCDYIPQKQLAGLWLKITGDSNIVDIRAVHNAKKSADYVARYAANPAELKDLDFESLVVIFDALHGRRICGTFGNAKKISLRAKRPADESGTWLKIADWELIVRAGRNDTMSKAVVKSWLTGQPVSDQFCLGLITDFQEIENPPPKDIIISPVSGWFDEMMS